MQQSSVAQKDLIYGVCAEDVSYRKRVFTCAKFFDE